MYCSFIIIQFGINWLVSFSKSLAEIFVNIFYFLKTKTNGQIIWFDCFIWDFSGKAKLPKKGNETILVDWLVFNTNFSGILTISWDNFWSTHNSLIRLVNCVHFLLKYQDNHLPTETGNLGKFKDAQSALMLKFLWKYLGKTSEY
jgi:hypothetical protein